MLFSFLSTFSLVSIKTSALLLLLIVLMFSSMLFALIKPLLGVNKLTASSSFDLGVSIKSISQELKRKFFLQLEFLNKESIVGEAVLIVADFV